MKIALQLVSGLVEDDEVKVHAAPADIAVPLHELVGQRAVVIGAELGQNDRPVAGDGVRP